MFYLPHLIQNGHENEDTTQTGNIQQCSIRAYETLMRSVQINRGDEERKETCEDRRDDLTLLSLSHQRTTH